MKRPPVRITVYEINEMDPELARETWRWLLSRDRGGPAIPEPASQPEAARQEAAAA